MQISRKSFSNLQALAQGDFGGTLSELPLSGTSGANRVNLGSQASLDGDMSKRTQRYV